jgi:hypothetical protein
MDRSRSQRSTAWPSALCATIGLFLVTTRAHGQGGPPLETDDPGTPGNGHWEVNVAVTLERTSGTTLYEAPLGDANYGLGERIQLKLEIPLLFLHGTTDSRARLGNALVGVKWRFLQDSSSHLSVSTYPQLEIQNSLLVPDNSENDPGALLIPAELVLASGIIGVNAEAGYRIVHGEKDELMYGLALGYQASGTLELLTECNGRSDRTWESSELLCQVGTRDRIGDHFSLLAALGTGVAGDPAERPRFHMYLGLQSRW